MRLRLKGVYSNKKRLSDGSYKTYYTLRGVGALNPLPDDEGEIFAPGTPAFMRAYHAAIDAPRKARAAGTLQSIIDGYQRSHAFTSLAPRTKSDYLKAIIKIETVKLTENTPAFATYPIEVVDDPKIRLRLLDWRDSMAKSSPRQADATLGVLRIILEWGRDRGLLSHNHATRPKKVYRADRSDKLWLPNDLAAFRSSASDEMLLALELALWTGQRQADLLKLGWSSYDGAELDGLHFHDIRGTTCTMLAQKGATPSEIAAVLGWTVTTVNQMLDTYQAMTAQLSNNAVAKLEAKA